VESLPYLIFAKGDVIYAKYLNSLDLINSKQV
jgi:hypothetical protein